MLPGVHYLQDSGVEIEGVKFWGTPWTLRKGMFDIKEKPDEFARRCSLIPSDTQYLISHHPPLNILDLGWDKITRTSKCCETCGKTHPRFKHLGSRVLLDRVKEISPLVHQFGHVHNRHATVMRCEDLPTMFVNASLDLDWRPTVFDLLV